MANGKIKRSSILSTQVQYTTNTIEEFINDILQLVISYGVGCYMFGITRSSMYYCLVTAAVYSSTRAIVQVIPQADNIREIYVGSANNNNMTYKKIPMLSL